MRANKIAAGTAIILAGFFLGGGKWQSFGQGFLKGAEEQNADVKSRREVIKDQRSCAELVGLPPDRIKDIYAGQFDPRRTGFFADCMSMHNEKEAQQLKGEIARQQREAAEIQFQKDWQRDDAIRAQLSADAAERRAADLKRAADQLEYELQRTRRLDEEETRRAALQQIEAAQRQADIARREAEDARHRADTASPP